MTDLLIIDMFERPVEVGDTLAVAFRAASNASLHFGTVLGFKTKKRDDEVIPTIVVEWITAGNWRPSVSQIEFDNGRFAVVNLPVDNTDESVVS